MKHKRLKAVAHSATKPFAVVHDRKATELPAGAFCVEAEFDDPYERGERISALRNVRDDPLGALWARRQIDDAKYCAGRHWQKLYEQAEIGGIRGMDTTREPVDGGGFRIEFLTERRRRAVAKLARCTELLGLRGDALVRDVLGKGMFLTQAAADRGLATRRGLEYLGVRFRECLETLAHEFGYA